jgi:hypothetical protein
MQGWKRWVLVKMTLPGERRTWFCYPKMLGAFPASEGSLPMMAGNFF